MKIGDYEVIKEIGHGGMGVVYKAKDSQNDRLVAIKMLTGAGARDPRERMGLVREARAAGGLKHQNIVTVFDIGQHNGWLYLVMEYLSGGSLDQVLRSSVHLSLVQKLNIMVQVCAGLGYAHARGVIHRDIKPHNIFLPRGLPVKIVDFGLAKVLESEELTLTWSRRTQLAGTPVYMSPEQISGLQLDARTDIWSVGVVLYQLITKTLPFSGRTLTELFQKILHNAFPPLLGSSSGPSQELLGVLERALAKDRSIRYAMASQLEGDLRRILALIGSEQSVPEMRRSEEGEPGRTEHPESTRYAPPVLGFQKKPPEKVRFKNCTFSGSGLREGAKQAVLEIGAIGPIVLIALVLTAISLLPFLLVSTDSFGAEVLATLMLLVWVPVLILLSTRHAAATTASRKCQTCSRRMVRVSKWTRFVSTKTEIAVGLSDCIAALREGSYEDAAKLLSVHGTETPVSYSVTRYILEFWQCRRCLDRSALLIIEDLLEERWKRRDTYMESYTF
ncbi:MAG: serine/threonine-protein kinase [Candidatus Acidiferrum sp.]